jgi:hypothetical protein
MDDFDLRAAAVASRQHSLITLAQVIAIGGDRHRAHRRIKSGRWHRVHAGTYFIAGHPFTWETRLLAAALFAGDGAVASHRSAAVLWNIEGFRKGPPEISVSRHQRPQRLDARVHESTDLHLADPVLRRGIPTTGLVRTLLDVSSVISYEAEEHAIDATLRTTPTQWPDLYESLTLHSRRGRNGCGRLRAVLDHRFGDKVITDSWFERMVRRLLLDAGFPAPESQWDVYDGPTLLGELDLAWPDAKVGAELQSKAHHLNPTAFERDTAKLNRIQLQGWHVLLFTWRMYKERPDLICTQLAQALARSGVVELRVPQPSNAISDIG